MAALPSCKVLSASHIKKEHQCWTTELILSTPTCSTRTNEYYYLQFYSHSSGQPCMENVLPLWPYSSHTIKLLFISYFSMSCS